MTAPVVSGGSGRSSGSGISTTSPFAESGFDRASSSTIAAGGGRS